MIIMAGYYPDLPATANPFLFLQMFYLIGEQSKIFIYYVIMDKGAQFLDPVPSCSPTAESKEKNNWNKKKN